MMNIFSFASSLGAYLVGAVVFFLITIGVVKLFELFFDQWDRDES